MVRACPENPPISVVWRPPVCAPLRQSLAASLPLKTPYAAPLLRRHKPRTRLSPAELSPAAVPHWSHGKREQPPRQFQCSTGFRGVSVDGAGDFWKASSRPGVERAAVQTVPIVRVRRR
ncbi:hypothetical protein MRX96_051760 [Rhipicephalus microplus]